MLTRPRQRKGGDGKGCIVSSCGPIVLSILTALAVVGFSAIVN